MSMIPPNLTAAQKVSIKVQRGAESLASTIRDQIRLYKDFWEKESQQDIVDGLNANYVASKAFFVEHYQLATALNAAAEYAGIDEILRVPAATPEWFNDNGTAFEIATP